MEKLELESGKVGIYEPALSGNVLTMFVLFVTVTSPPANASFNDRTFN